MLLIAPNTPYLYHSQIYTLIGFATHSETLDKMVVFRRPHSELLWAQPLPDFPDELDAMAEPSRTCWPRVAVGRYKHFKGDQYTVDDLVTDSVDRNPLVLYRNERDEFWLRPASMFLDRVDRGDYHGPRFIFLGKTPKETAS